MPTSSDVRRSAWRVVGFAALPLSALVVVWWVTRAGVPNDASSHTTNHAAMANQAGDSARAVSLTGAQGRRIGITFAPVAASTLTHEVRTVGQVTIDETRLQTISLKIDGWVEQLDVDFTGRAVSRGEPLL